MSPEIVPSISFWKQLTTVVGKGEEPTVRWFERAYRRFPKDPQVVSILRDLDLDSKKRAQFKTLSLKVKGLEILRILFMRKDFTSNVFSALFQPAGTYVERRSTHSEIRAPCWFNFLGLKKMGLSILLIETSEQAGILVVSALCIFLPTLLVGLRFVAKLRARRKLDASDYCILAALVRFQTFVSN